MITCTDVEFAWVYDIATRRPRAWVKTVGDFHIEVMPMLTNWRLHTIRVGRYPWEWSERFWCYKGRGPESFTAALLAAHAWDGADDTEPAGWIKAYDGRVGETGTR
jgi:hypothetical protein